jgi:hypothetical protein
LEEVPNPGMESAVSNFLDICPPFEIVDVCVMYR